MTFVGVVFAVLVAMMLCGQISLWRIIKIVLLCIVLLFSLALCVAALDAA